MKESFFTKCKRLSLMLPVFVFFAFPSSSNFRLDSFEMGAGGEKDMNSANYKLEGIAGEVNGEQSSSNFKFKTGLFYVQMASVPGAPTFINSSNWYNKLKLTINTSNNPTDATYAIAISTDNFTTTRYVQSTSNTIGNTLGTEDFQTYANWGGASGFNIIGLDPGTTYKVKIKARRGNFTESGYGPEATAATQNPTLSFDIDVSPTDTETAGPYSVGFGELNNNAVTTAASKVWIDMDTNGEYGGIVYLYSDNTGLRSPRHNYTITSATANLSVATEGWGVQGSSVAQSSGGPLVIESPYDGTSENVGVVNTAIRPIFSTVSSIIGGRGSFSLKVKTSATTPASSDYATRLTLIVAAIF